MTYFLPWFLREAKQYLFPYVLLFTVSFLCAMDVDKKHPVSDVGDGQSCAEGQIDIGDTIFAGERKPESLANLGDHEIVALNKKLVRKIDLLILPPIGILYILNYIDRQNLSAAKLQGITEDLNMTTEQFATAISILFVGYLPFQIPSNLIITKISRPGMYICTAVVIWGAISAATAAVHSYGQLLAVRAILGAVEAVFFPGMSSFSVILFCFFRTRLLCPLLVPGSPVHQSALDPQGF